MKPLRVNGKDLSRVSLKFGPHTQGKPGRCVMEMTALLSGDEERLGIKTDRPHCTNSAITEIFIELNDNAPNQKDRNKLRAFLPRLLQATPGIPDQKVVAKFIELIPWVLRRGNHEESEPNFSLQFFSPGHAHTMNSYRVCNSDGSAEWGRADMGEYYDRYLEIADELLDWHEKQLAEAGLMHKIPEVKIES